MRRRTILSVQRPRNNTGWLARKSSLTLGIERKHGQEESTNPRDISGCAVISVIVIGMIVVQKLERVVQVAERTEVKLNRIIEAASPVGKAAVGKGASTKKPVAMTGFCYLLIRRWTISVFCRPQGPSPRRFPNRRRWDEERRRPRVSYATRWVRSHGPWAGFPSIRSVPDQSPLGK